LLACFNFLWHNFLLTYGDMDSAADCASEAYGYARKAYYSNTLVEAQYYAKEAMDAAEAAQSAANSAESESY
jgi:hypothetical protein